MGRVRIEAAGTGTPLFVGIARQSDADSYLKDVGHDQVTRLDFAGGSDDIRYQRHPGGVPAA
ncbi:hypothetical protein [Nonomuraea basaltis]|uniref:hypothetical protein n=1 Tax=Nonomuraea basaltis TaxID=2495887 RepID=UPI00110C4076|nr:hypothetical protein [Nonomuraea basaltis]TMR90758.1 hypothetical protein EJK15_53520 [Nonomuraea basaltis]